LHGSDPEPLMSELGQKGDISVVLTYVWFSSESGHQLSAANGAFGRHDRQDNAGMRLVTAASR
jgi:hypothetical protein